MYQLETKFAKTKFRLLFYTITETAEKDRGLSPVRDRRSEMMKKTIASSLPTDENKHDLSNNNKSKIMAKSYKNWREQH
jgi:hypothetical protein